MNDNTITKNTITKITCNLTVVAIFLIIAAACMCMCLFATSDAGWAYIGLGIFSAVMIFALVTCYIVLKAVSRMVNNTEQEHNDNIAGY